MTETNTRVESQTHEPDALGPRTMIVWGAALAALVAVSLLMMNGLMSLFQQQTAVNGADDRAGVERPISDDGTRPSPVAGQPAQARVQQRRRLEEYGWVNRRQNVAHIPIERAMQLLLERGLPVRDTSPDHE